MKICQMEHWQSDDNIFDHVNECIIFTLFQNICKWKHLSEVKMEEISDLISSAVTKLNCRFTRLQYGFSQTVLNETFYKQSHWIDCKLIKHEKQFPVSKYVFIVNFDESRQVQRNTIINYYQKMESECRCLILNQSSTVKSVATCVRKKDGQRRYLGKKKLHSPPLLCKF